MSSEIKQVVVVGGGSAGWLTACYLAAEHAGNDEGYLNITLLESPNVSTIGVGEGTWPSMRSTLEKIGIDETEFLTACDASFKQASQFNQWRTGQQEDVYYHPFTYPEGYTQFDVHQLWRQQQDHDFASLTTPQVHICAAAKAPKQLQTPNYAGVTTYGYHLDSGKFAELLKKHATQRLGVTHVVAHMTAIQSHSNGNIKALELDDYDPLDGDLFIDCTGMRSLLLGEHFKIPLIEQGHILFNDSALATQVNYPDPDEDIPSSTLSTAQSCGWIWDIALPTRRGVGHTYSSKHITDEAAEKQLRDYIAQSRSEEYAQSLSLKKIKFVPGYRKQFWTHNCVAIGMSSGFIEPLEASALAMVELSVKMLSEQFPRNDAHMTQLSERFNQRFTYRWQRVIEFLKLHYVLSQRDDSDYWQAHRMPDSVPERLQSLLALWQYQTPSRYDFIQNEEVFPSASYQFVLYGMGFDTKSPQFNTTGDGQRLLDHCLTKTQQLLQGLPSNRTLLNQIKHRGFGNGN